MIEQSKSIFLTGLNSGIGLSLAQILVQEGFEITGVVRSKVHLSEGLQDLADQIELFETDLGQPEAVEALIELVKSRSFGYIVLNAGCAKIMSSHEESDEELQKIMQTNLISNMRLVRAFLPNVLKNQTKIIFVSSLSAHIPAEAYSSYAASKAGLSQYYHSLKREYPGLPLLCLEPGAIDTPMHAKSGNYPPSKKMFKDQEEFARKMYEAMLHKTGVHTLYWDWRLIRTLVRVTT